MNFYKHYIGDFNRDTGHLSLTERGAYLALIHHYYATEHPLPNNHISLCRIAGAITKDEQAAVKVAMGFFIVCESGLMHPRIEGELEKAGDVSNTNREIALAREAKRRAQREARKEHDSCTNRAQSVERALHEQSTNQTPDLIQEEANASLSGTRVPACPVDRIIDAYETHLPTLPVVRRSLFKAGKNVAAMRQRWHWVMTSFHERGERKGQRLAETAEDAIAWFDRYFAYVSESEFLTGENGKWGACDMAWLLKQSNFESVLSGKYHAKEAA